MTLTPQQTQALNRSRIELILLGMVLARADDRAYILKHVDIRDMQSELIWDAIEGVRQQKAKPVMSMLRMWGMDTSSKRRPAELILERIAAMGRDQRARDVLNRALLSSTVADDLEQSLESALAEIQYPEGTK